jgi:hypothetical protein
MAMAMQIAGALARKLLASHEMVDATCRCCALVGSVDSKDNAFLVISVHERHIYACHMVDQLAEVVTFGVGRTASCTW